MRIYFDDVMKNKVSGLDAVVDSKKLVCSVNKKKIDDLSSFFEGIILECDNNDNVNLIEFDDVKIKSKDNIVDVNDIQKFGVRNAYVASIDKKIISGVINFYDLLKTSVFSSGKLIFDASKETRLQSAMHTEFINPNDLEKNVVNNVDSIIQDKPVVQEEHKKGHINIFWICIVASIFLTIFTVLKVMGIAIF